MNGFLDFTSILILAVAVGIFLKLRSVLGRRTGNERPPFDPYSRREPLPGREQAGADKTGGEKVITLPRAKQTTGRAPATSARGVEERLGGLAKAGSQAELGLRRIAERDPSFDARAFIDGARSAYEMIVIAFAEGDRRTLKQLLSREVFDSFVSAISAREQRQHKMNSTFVGIDSADFVDAQLSGDTAQVTVRFVSQIISAVHDKEGRIVEGDPNQVATVTDVWTFARDVTSRDPNWTLVATEAA